MNLIMTIRDQDFLPNVPVVDTSNFREREAVRAVLINDAGNVILLSAFKHGYHKLPGGGIDDNESIETALARELMEEVGCKAEIVTELGMIIEYRDSMRLKQISYCYLAEQLGEQVESALEEDEIAEGLQEMKVDSINEAVKLLENDKPDTLEGLFMQKRDLCFLRTASAEENHDV